MTLKQTKTRMPVWIVVVTMICFYAILGTFAEVTGMGKAEYLDLNDAVSAKIHWQNGTTTKYDDLAIPNMNTGDEITFYVPIPEDSGRLIALCFYQYHSEIEVFLGELQIYAFGQDITREGKMYGNEYVSVLLPEAAAGQTLTVRVKQMEGSGSSHFTYFRLMRMEDARLYPLIGSVTQFLLFAIMLFLSMCTFGLYLIATVLGRQKVPRYVLYLSIFSFLISNWQLSYRRLFFVLLTDHFVCGVSEYYALYLAPIPFLAYMAASRPYKVPRWIYAILCGLSSVLAGGILLLRYTRGTHIIVYEGLYYAVLFYIIVITIVTEVATRIRHRGQAADSMNAGILAALGLAGLQIILLGLKNFLVGEFWIKLLQRMDLGALAILFYMASLYFYAGQGLVKAVRDRALEEQTRRLAYLDVLTELPNRLFLKEHLEALPEDAVYAIVFMDADGLKEVNDRLGHETGDRLIYLIGAAIREAFPEGHGFYGRIGGDEFMALLPTREEAEQFAQDLEEKVREMGEGQPFATTVSWGIADSSEGPTPEDVKNLADQRMYVRKEEHHKARQ